MHDCVIGGGGGGSSLHDAVFTVVSPPPKMLLEPVLLNLAIVLLFNVNFFDSFLIFFIKARLKFV